MATAVLTNTPTVISLCESITGWSGDTFILDSGVKVQGSNSVSCAMTTNGTNNIQYATSNAPGGQFDATNIHIRFWFYLEFMGNIDTEANDGIQVQIISDAGTALYTVSGSDTYDGGFVQAVVYTGNTPTSGSAPTTNCSTVGLTVNTISKPRNVPSNCYIDAMYFGDGFTVTGGTSGDEIDWSHIAALDLTERYGIVTNIDDIYFLGGAVTIGTATTTWFKSGQKVQFKDSSVLSSFSSTLFELNFEGTGCRVDITGGAIGAGGAQDFLLDASDTNIVSFDMAGVQFAQANSILFDAGQTIINCVFDNCGQVVPLTATFTGHIFANCVDTGGAVLFPSADTNISGLTFVVCDNGVEYDAVSDSTSPAFNDFTFDDAAGNYDVNNTSGSAVSISKNNGSNPNSYNPGGDTVTFLGASVTTKITVRDADDGSLVSDARVLAWVTSGVNFPYQASVTGITGSGTTATVTHPTHGLSTNDNIWIEGANEENYRGAYQITVTGASTYTYTTVESTGGTPATGTITATFCLLNADTVAGVVSDTRVIGTDQPFDYRVRKSTTSPLYRQSKGSDTSTSAAGKDITVNLVSDE